MMSSKNKRPNLLFISTDQQHFQALSHLGNPYVQTPHMDFLAEHGVTFSHAYTTNPVCGPARSSFFTGRMTSETGIIDNQSKGIRQGMPTLGTWFREHSDYQTVFAGKWHAGGSPFTYDIPGFDVIASGLNRCGILGDAIVASACDAFIRSHDRKNPFLMATQLLQPHDVCETIRFNHNHRKTCVYPDIEANLPPLPNSFAADHLSDITKPLERDAWSEMDWRYYLYSFYRHVEMVNAELGRIVLALKETNQINNTVIVFTSDHGEGLGHHRHVAKDTLFDESVRVPLILSCPGLIRENKIDNSTLSSGIDLLPTLCDFAAIPIPDGCQGISLKETAMHGSPSERNYIFAEANSNTGRMVRSERFKYITYGNTSGTYLFDLKHDPDETNNLANDPAYLRTLEQHQEALNHWESNLDLAPDIEPWPQCPH